jgi:hypothetical protein
VCVCVNDLVLFPFFFLLMFLFGKSFSLWFLFLVYTDYVSNDMLRFLVQCINFISSHLQYIGCYPVVVSIRKFDSQNPQYNMIYPFLMKRQFFFFQNFIICVIVLIMFSSYPFNYL